MGPIQNFWWLQTSKIMKSQDPKQKYVVQSLSQISGTFHHIASLWTGMLILDNYISTGVYAVLKQLASLSERVG